MEWIGEAQIQVGDHEAPPPVQVSPFLAGFVDGLVRHVAVREAHLLAADTANIKRRNPTRHVAFRFAAESYDAAKRLALGELCRAGIRAGVEAIDPGSRQFGWMVSIDVEPA